MQRREYQVTGQSRLDGDTSRLNVTDLADHNDVGVLPQKCPQGRAKRHTDVGADQHLVNAVDVIFDRILRRHDVHIFVVHL